MIWKLYRRIRKFFLSSKTRNECLRILALLLVVLLQGSVIRYETPPSPLEGSEITWSKFPATLTLDLRTYIVETCREFEVPLSLGLAVIWAESRGYTTGINANKHPETGEILSTDHGLMQLNSLTFENTVYRKVSGTNLYRQLKPRENPKDNIYLGIEYLSLLYRELRSWPDAIMSYNCGTYRVKHNKVPAITKQYLNTIVTFMASY